MELTPFQPLRLGKFTNSCLSPGLKILWSNIIACIPDSNLQKFRSIDTCGTHPISTLKLSEIHTIIFHYKILGLELRQLSVNFQVLRVETGWVPHVSMDRNFCRLLLGIHTIIFHHKILGPKLRQLSVNLSSLKGWNRVGSTCIKELKFLQVAVRDTYNYIPSYNFESRT